MYTYMYYHIIYSKYILFVNISINPSLSGKILVIVHVRLVTCPLNSNAVATQISPKKIDQQNPTTKIDTKLL
jgi:hypothetical protein